MLDSFSMAFWCTDGYRVYKDELPKAKHIVGKLYTQRIERENLTLRSRLKRIISATLGFESMKRAYATIKGIEVMWALHKGQAESFYYGHPLGEMRLVNRYLNFKPLSPD